MYPTAEASSEVCIPPPSQAPQCASYRGVKGAVCITPQSPVIKISKKASRCASHCGVKLRGVHLTAGQTAHCEVKIEIFVSLWLLLKGQSGEIL